MTKSIFILIAIIFLAPILSFATEPDYPSCEITKERPISFSSKTPSDTLRVRISGKPCYQATLYISVFKSDGREIYKYAAPFKKHVAAHWEDSNLAQEALDFANDVLEKAQWGKSESLPVWKPENEFYEENSSTVSVSKTEYKKYRTQNIPVLWHLTFYEGWRYVVYDQKTKTSIVLLDGGL